MMRKAITTGNLAGKEGSGRRYWMRANPVGVGPAGPSPVGSNPAGAKAPLGEATGKRPPKARFLEPYRLSDERRGALIMLLARDAVGDGESRELFASAIEYDIANAHQALAREMPQAPEAAPGPAPAPPPPLETPAEAVETTPTLPTDLAYTARSLAERIAGLEVPLRDAIAAALQRHDRFRRGYDGAYLDALCLELIRLADAVAAPPQDLVPQHLVTESPEAPAPAPSAAQPSPPEPSLSEGMRRFLRRVARVYEEVLDDPADLRSDGTFLKVLELVSQEVGLKLPHDGARLAAVWQGE